jgi:hypothetical protein
MAVEAFYVQLLFDERVAGANDAGWVSVALIPSTPAAFSRALAAYHEFRHPRAGTPVGVPVVSEAEIRREGGERAVRRAAAGLTALAFELGRAA